MKAGPLKSSFPGKEMKRTAFNVAIAARREVKIIQMSVSQGLPVIDPVSTLSRTSFVMIAVVRFSPGSHLRSYGPNLSMILGKSKKLRAHIISHESGNQDITSGGGE